MDIIHVVTVAMEVVEAVTVIDHVTIQYLRLTVNMNQICLVVKLNVKAIVVNQLIPSVATRHVLLNAVLVVHVIKIADAVNQMVCSAVIVHPTVILVYLVQAVIYASHAAKHVAKDVKLVRPDVLSAAADLTPPLILAVNLAMLAVCLVDISVYLNVPSVVLLHVNLAYLIHAIHLACPVINVALDLHWAAVDFVGLDVNLASQN